MGKRFCGLFSYEFISFFETELFFNESVGFFGFRYFGRRFCGLFSYQFISFFGTECFFNESVVFFASGILEDGPVAFFI